MSLKKKRVLSAFIIVIMLVGMLSSFAIVANAEEPYLKVASATMTDGQYLVKGSVSPITELPANADSYAYYKDGILTLHNYSLNAQGMPKLIEAKGKLSLKILLEGENILKGNPATTTAIWATYEVDIMGSGSLTISNVACGIDKSDENYKKPLYITDATLNISSTNEAINSNSTLNVTAAKLTVESTATGKSAIKNNGDISFYASEVEATANGCAIESEGEFVNVNIYGSKVKAVSSGSQAIKYSYGLTFDNGGITENVVTKASTNADGSSWVTYDKDNDSNYKYVECELPGYFVVSFDANGGSGYTKSAAFRNGESGYESCLNCTFTAPDGKYFYGWDKSIIGRPITENLTLKAVWRDKTDVDYVEFVISGYEAGANASGIQVTNVTEGVVVDSSTINVKIPPHETATTIEADRFYHIVFEFYFTEPEKYSMNFDLANRADFRMCGMAAAETVEYNAETGRYSVVFTGEKIPENNVNVNFYANEGDAEPITTVKARGIYKLPTAESLNLSDTADKRFAGWKWIDDNAYSNIYGRTPTYQPDDYCFVAGEMTLVAQWEDIPKSTITFYKNDGTEDVVKSESIPTGNTYLVSGLPKLDDVGEKKFMGWTTQKGSVIIVDKDFVVNENIALYALWVEYPEKITFKLEGYEIGKNVMDIKLTDDKGFLSNNNLILEGEGRFIIYEDNNGKPAIVMTEEEYNNYLGFVNGKFEAGKSYWIIVIPEYDGYHEGAGGKFISLPESAEAYKLEGASDAQVIINGELYAYGFKLAPLSSATDTPPADSGNSGESGESNTENTTPDDNKETNATDSTDEKVTDKEDDEADAPTKDGCGSSIALSTLAIAGLIGTALIIKKKEN